jgi:endonuclease/exonuclease/phosphatase family metal-dependent hydrolase
MQRLLVALGCGLLLTAAPLALAKDQKAESGPSPLKCVSFNLLHGGLSSGLTGSAQDLDERLHIAAQELRSLEADIIGLQEASVSRQRGNVAQKLASELDFAHVYTLATSRIFSSERAGIVLSFLMNFAEGPAIVSRFPITAWQAWDLPRCGRFFDPRVLLCADIRTPWGLLQVCSTHTGGELCQAKSVAALIQKRRGSLPLIVMGDFNATEDSPSVMFLTREAGFIDTFRKSNPLAFGPTVWQWVYASRPMALRRVDYVFLVPGKDFPGRVLSSRVVLNTSRSLEDGKILWPSDHYGVLTEVEVFPPQ